MSRDLGLLANQELMVASSSAYSVSGEAQRSTIT